MKVKEESEKIGLNLNIQKTKIIASSHITSWQTDGETMETMRHFIFLGSKITADCDCSHEIKRLLGRKGIKGYAQHRHDDKKQRHYFADKGLYSQSYGISSNHAWMWEMDHKGQMFSNCGAGEDSWEPLGQQGDQTSQSQGKSTLNIHWKDWSWNFNTLATWCKEMTHWKRPWCWERLRARGGGDDRGWDGWMAFLIQWTWVWEKSGR